MNSIKVFEAFAGVGCQHQALKNINVDFEIVGISEIDKFAIKTYEALHGKVNNYGDISKIEPSELPDFDLFTYSFPCQDISVAGYRLGLEKGSNTRSSLLWECEKIIEEKRPKYLLMENVKNLVGKKNLPNFQKWLELLEDMGYTNYWQVLNAKDFGVPQNRERVFCVSIRGEHKPYKFPKKQKLTQTLLNMLEENVEEKYYFKNEKSKLVIKEILKKYDYKKMNNIECVDGSVNEPKIKNISNCITARYDCGVSNQRSLGLMVIEKPVRIAGLFDTENSRHQAGSVWDTNALAPTLDTMQGGWRQPCIVDNSKENEFNTTSTSNDNFVKNLKIRKLTPKECWKLMGFTEEQIQKAFSSGNSNAQLYKQAGNGIVVSVLENIFSKLFKEGEQDE